MLRYDFFNTYYWVYIKRIELKTIEFSTERQRLEWYEYTKARLLYINDRKFLLWRNVNAIGTDKYHIIDFQTRILICTGSTIKKAIEALDKVYISLIKLYDSPSYKGYCNVTYNEISKRKVLGGMEDDFAKYASSFDEYMEIK